MDAEGIKQIQWWMVIAAWLMLAYTIGCYYWLRGKVEKYDMVGTLKTNIYIAALFCAITWPGHPGWWSLPLPYVFGIFLFQPLMFYLPRLHKVWGFFAKTVGVCGCLMYSSILVENAGLFSWIMIILVAGVLFFLTLTEAYEICPHCHQYVSFKHIDEKTEVTDVKESIERMTSSYTTTETEAWSGRKIITHVYIDAGPYLERIIKHRTTTTRLCPYCGKVHDTHFDHDKRQNWTVDGKTRIDSYDD